MNYFSFKEILSVTLILFSVIDIIGSVPVIVNLRKKAGHIQSGKATLVAAGIMFAFLFLGERILGLFGVDISSFAVAGGLILFLIGMEMVLGRNIFKHEDLQPSSASIVPIAFPLIAGAGTMTTLLSLRAAYELPNILVGVVLNLIFIYIVLKSSGYIEKKLGNGGLDVMRKVFGIILLAIAIKLIKDNFFLVQQLP
jgi:multiple antibiotic resistance protein